MPRDKRVRAYVTEQASIRMKKYAAECNISLIDAYDRLIMSHVDDRGRLVSMSPLGDVAKEVEELAKAAKLTIPETVSMMVRTIKTLYNPKLPLWKALRGIHELEKEVEEK